jgi:hypothetical protein
MPENLKWAASQEAVTLPWLSAHSIRTGIGGDTYIVDPPPRLSRSNFQTPTSWFQSGENSHANALQSIDTAVAMVLFLMVLEAALLPAESASNTSKDSVSSIIRKWTRHSDN